MYRCSAKCCDNLQAGMEDTQRCIETCSSPLMKAQNYIQSQVENFQVSHITFYVFMPLRPWPAGGIEHSGCPYIRPSVDQGKIYV